MNKKGNILSLYFGYHDSCVTFSSREEILLHLEAERYFRKKHIHVTADQMMELIDVGLKYLNLDIESFDLLYLAAWNNQFSKEKVSIKGKSFTPIFTSHHFNHIGTTYPSGFHKSLVVCADGGSEDGTTRFYLKNGRNIETLGDFDSEPITGKFYGTITQMIINPNMGRAHDTYPGHTMGLVALGEYSEELYGLLEKYWPEINKLHTEGVSKLMKTFGLNENYKEPWKDKRRKDLAFTAQKFWQERLFKKIEKYAYLSENLCLVGGCALNVLLNSAVRESNLFINVYTTPVASDNGQSLGAVLFHHPEIRCEYPYLGRGYGDLCEEPERLLKDLLNRKIVAWYQGRSEIGARALGHRSFLSLPNPLNMKIKLSEKVKNREPYRPVAPIVTEESLSKFFNTDKPSPYMTFSPKVRKITKKIAPAIVHFDDSSRVQTISSKNNPILHEVLVKVEKATRAPILMNTSFNIAGEPIVDTPEDALSSFKASKAEVLYINGKRHEK